MEKRKNPLSIKVIYWSTQVIFWLFVAVFFTSIVAAAALQFVDIGGNMSINMELPIEISYTEKGSVELFGVHQQLEFVEATGKLHFINTNPTLTKMFGFLVLGVMSLLLYIFIMFKRFIGNVYNGIIFERFNIRMLQKMAYGIVAFWFFSVLYSRLFYYFIAKNIEFEHLEFSGNINSYSFLLFLALFLWVLSHIFMIGLKMKEEQDLTV